MRQKLLNTRKRMEGLLSREEPASGEPWYEDTAELEAPLRAIYWCEHIDISRIVVLSVTILCDAVVQIVVVFCAVCWPGGVWIIAVSAVGELPHLRKLGMQGKARQRCNDHQAGQSRACVQWVSARRVLPLVTSLHLMVHRSLYECGGGMVADGRLLDLIRRVSTFGMCLMKLDIRQVGRCPDLAT